MLYINNDAKVKQGYTVYLWSENFYQEKLREKITDFCVTLVKVTAVTIIKIETSLKTDDFGLKPGNHLVLNCPTLKGGAIDLRDIQGFSPINFIFNTFLDQSQNLMKKM
jgi:hypothetical protein